jgi:pimeloyl-ACP methyl ester carboxylesterase
MACATTG